MEQLKGGIEMPDIEKLIDKFLGNQFDLSTFKKKEILFLKSAFQQGASIMFHELKNSSESVFDELIKENKELHESLGYHISQRKIFAEWLKERDKKIDELIQQNQQLQEVINKLRAEALYEKQKYWDLEKQIAELQAEKEKLMADFMEVQTDLQNKIFKLEKQLNEKEVIN